METAVEPQNDRNTASVIFHGSYALVHARDYVFRHLMIIAVRKSPGVLRRTPLIQCFKTAGNHCWGNRHESHFPER